MADILIRNVDDDDVALLDDLAAQQGLSRNELLRRHAHELAQQCVRESVTVTDVRRSLALSADLLDQDVMRGAWE